MKNLADTLRDIVSGDVFDDTETLKTFSQDASLFAVRPAVVVAPKDSADVQAVVRFVAENKQAHPELSIAPRSGGTCMSGGSLTNSIMLDFSRYMNRVVSVSEEGGADRVAGHATVQPGAYYRDFEKETLQKNLIMPSFPASREICAVGGMVGNNAGGEKTLAYGKTEEYIRSLKVVLADGNEYEFHALGRDDLSEKMDSGSFEGRVYRHMTKLLNTNRDLIRNARPNVSKNSAGYYLWNVVDEKTGLFDLTRLFVGSQGTLGIVTEITFGLVRPKRTSRMLVVFLRDLAPLADIVNTVLRYEPESFESYDDHTLKLALRFFPQFVKLLKGNIFTLAWQFLPEVGMFLSGGFPKLVLTAEFAGDDAEAVLTKARTAQKALEQFGVRTHVTKREREVDKYHTIRRESFSLLRDKVKDKQTAPFIDDIIVRPEHLPAFLPKLQEMLDEYEETYDFVYTIAGHAGDGNFHIIPLVRIDDPALKQIIQDLSQKVYALVLEYEGSITAEHNDGIIRTPFLRQMYGEEVYGLFEETKNIFDPDTIFNPGKKVGGTINEALEHLKKS